MSSSSLARSLVVDVLVEAEDVGEVGVRRHLEAAAGGLGATGALLGLVGVPGPAIIDPIEVGLLGNRDHREKAVRDEGVRALHVGDGDLGEDTIDVHIAL